MRKKKNFIEDTLFNYEKIKINFKNVYYRMSGIIVD